MQVMKITKTIYRNSEGEILYNYDKRKDYGSYVKRFTYTTRKQKVKVYENHEVMAFDKELRDLHFPIKKYRYYIYSMKGELLFITNYLWELNIEPIKE